MQFVGSHEADDTGPRGLLHPAAVVQPGLAHLDMVALQPSAEDVDGAQEAVDEGGGGVLVDLRRGTDLFHPARG